MDTQREFSSDSARRAVKQLFALARASFDISYETCGTWFDESASTIKAWCDPKRQHCPPTWALVRLRQKHAGMAAYVDIGLEAMAKQGADLGPVAHSLEAQMNVTVGAIAMVLGEHSTSTATDNAYDTAETERQLAVLISLRKHTDRAIEAAQRRLGVAATQPQIRSCNESDPKRPDPALMRPFVECARPTCDDCGEDVPEGGRRYRCKACDQLVCGWCMGHVHSGSPLHAMRAEAKAPVSP